MNDTKGKSKLYVMQYKSLLLSGKQRELQGLDEINYSFMSKEYKKFYDARAVNNYEVRFLELKGSLNLI